MSAFKNKACILHHFTSLDWSPPHIFITPNYPLFTPKNPLFNHYFALFGHVFHGSKRFYLYHCSGYLCFSPRVLQHLALHFASFYLAFSTKTHFILLQIAQKQVFVAVSLNKNTFCLHAQLTPFCIKTNLRENRFFAARWAVGGRKGHSEC